MQQERLVGGRKTQGSIYQDSKINAKAMKDDIVSNAFHKDGARCRERVGRRAYEYYYYAHWERMIRWSTSHYRER